MIYDINHSVLWQTYVMVTSLDELVNWNQSAHHVNDKGYSLAVHVAEYFNLREYTMEYGQFYLAKRMGITVSMLRCLLYLCGAPISPFAAFTWNIRPEIVWERMMMVDSIMDENKMYLIESKNINIFDYEGIFKFNSLYIKDDIHWKIRLLRIKGKIGKFMHKLL